MAFGPFRLFPVERLLEQDGVAVVLGGRALDILIALAETPGEVVNKKDLMARVWPDVTVEEGSLRFHIAALRKVLGEGVDGARYISNVAGRGYSFVAASSRLGEPQVLAPASPPPVVLETPTLPNRLARMVGRGREIEAVGALLAEQRVVTVVGAGGIGKTTVAVAVAHAAVSRYGGAVHFVDLAALAHPDLVAGAIASTLGLVVQSQDAVAALIVHLRQRPMLLVLDNCEHVIDAVAALVERIFEQAETVDVLATSREALRIEGEQVYALPALETPPADEVVTAEAIMAYPAAELFVERVVAGSSPFRLSDAEAPLVAEICRKLDGMALAIELAAGRVAAYGVQGTADLLDSRIRLLWHGRRTAPMRQQTLSATLDWSYNLLQDAERRVLDRLSVFVGAFELEAAKAVVADQGLDATAVVEALAGLVAKSLVSSQPVAGETRYHLLQTTRAYVRAKAAENEDVEGLHRLHALYFTDFLERNVGGPGPASETRSIAFYGQHVGNVRAALEWSLSAPDQGGLAVRLAAAAAALFLELSLLGECEAWTRRALQRLDAGSQGSQEEMKLQAAHGLSLMFTRGNGEEVKAALIRGVELARTWGDPYREIQILGGLNTFQTRISDYAGALETARRCEAVAAGTDDPDAVAMASWILGACLMLAGDQCSALAYCETALRLPPVSTRLNTLHFGYDHRMRALFTLSACLWLRGAFERSVEVAWRVIGEAEALDHPLTLNIILIYTLPVFIWMQDWTNAEALVERQMAHAEKHGLGPYRAVGLAFSGEIAVRTGRPQIGVPRLQTCVEQLRAERHNILTTVFLCAVAEGLGAQGKLEPARQAMAEAMSCFEQEGESFDAPEVFRVSAKFLALGDDADLPRAEALLGRALEMARRQCALSLELRAATDLAALWSRQGRVDEARELLGEVHGRFVEGFGAGDLLAAERLLEALATD